MDKIKDEYVYVYENVFFINFSSVFVGFSCKYIQR